MTPEEIEKAYQEVAFGYDEPDVMWMVGKSLREVSVRHGKEVTHTTDGQPILDDVIYVISKEGIYESR